LGTHEQEGKQHQERERVLVGHRDVGGTEGLDDTEARPPTMAPVTLPKPPMMLAAKALSAIEEPICTVTNRIGATRMPASPPSIALYMKVIMIISITGMPSRLAISLSWEVACIFLPSSVCSKNTY
jgi:hypothetical protein